LFEGPTNENIARGRGKQVFLARRRILFRPVEQREFPRVRIEARSA